MIDPLRLKSLLHRMLDIYSPSGKEADILAYIKGYLHSCGMAAITQPVDETRYNLALIPPDMEIPLAFIGHIDTVPAYDLDEFGFAEENGTIHGLGAADMKAGCAAMIEAFLAYRQLRGQMPPAGLFLVVGEEENGDGAEKLIDDYHFPWALIGEPTDLKPCLSCYGYVEIQIAGTGKRLHASMAGSGQTAIETLLHMMLRLTHFLRSRYPELVYNFRDLYSSRSGFAVPDRGEAWLDIHVPPDAHIGEIVTELEEVCMAAEGAAADIQRLFQIQNIDAGYRLPEKGSLVESLKTVYDGLAAPWEPADFRSHSDANQLWSYGVKPVVLGPGKLDNAHAADESVAFDQVCRAAEIYLNLLLAEAARLKEIS